MSAELYFAKERIQNMQSQAQVAREVRAAKDQNLVTRVFKFKFPRFFSLSRKHA
jgi:hypothetical protein